MSVDDVMASLVRPKESSTKNNCYIGTFQHLSGCIFMIYGVVLSKIITDDL